MSTAILQSSPNGTKRAVPLRITPALGEQIDQLHELRGLVRQSQEAERQLTAAVLAGLESAGFTKLAGSTAVASVDHRTNLRPDVSLFLEATGPAGHAALSVSVTAARRFLGADDLAAISETTITPALRVEAWKDTSDGGGAR